MSLLHDIILQNGVFEKQIIEACVQAGETKKSLTLLLQTSPKDIIRDKTKQSLLETINRDFQLNEHIFYAFTSDIMAIMDTTKSTLGATLFHFRAGDFGHHDPEDNKKYQKAGCYEHSVAYMVAWRHRAITQQDAALAQEMADTLSTYLGNKKLADIYLNDPLMKKDALRYFASLKKPTHIRTADIIPYRIIEGKAQVLLGTRSHFPLGTATLGGFVDFKRKNETSLPSDSEIAETYDFPDVRIVTALREGIEEMGKDVEHLSHTRQYGKTNQGGNIHYRIQQGDIRLEIANGEQIADNTFVEDPETMQSPTDPRGLVTSIFYIARLVSGTPIGSDDVAEIKRVDLDSIDDHHFAMKHHKEFLEKMRREFQEKKSP